MKGPYTVYALMKTDIRDEVRREFRDDSGSGYDFLTKEYDISWYPKRDKSRALDLAKRIKKLFPKTTVVVYDRNSTIILKLKGKK